MSRGYIVKIVKGGRQVLHHKPTGKEVKLPHCDAKYDIFDDEEQDLGDVVWAQHGEHDPEYAKTFMESGGDPDESPDDDEKSDEDDVGGSNFKADVTSGAKKLKGMAGDGE